MGYLQVIAAPDGTEMVLITRAEYQRLSGEPREDAVDIAAADRILAESDVRYPAQVVDAMLAGSTPLAAWRKHKGLSQAVLASAAGITQAAVSRLEKEQWRGCRRL